MEQHGKNPRKSVIAIVPARYESTRLPGKMLLPIAGKSLILHTLERGRLAKSVDRVIVATDDERIRDVVCGAGGEAVMTSREHRSGSDRIAEVAESLPEGTIIVNVQGDEPVISPETIDRAVEALLEDDSADMATTYEPIESLRELLNGNNVKVVVGDQGYALYFSRSPFPWPREASQRHGGDPNRAIEQEPELLRNYKKHTGLYVYRREYLLEFTRLPQTWLEKYEMLEQLRALGNGARIKVVEATSRSVGVDTRSDLERVRRMVETPNITYRRATREDLPAIARVHVDCWQRSFAGIVPQEFLDEMSVEKRIKAFEKGFEDDEKFYMMLVAEDAARGIVGFADMGESRDSTEFDGELYSIYFLPEFQRRGIGSLLFRMCQMELLARGKRSMYLESLGISPYRSFYENMGGEVVGSGSCRMAGSEFETVIYGWQNLNEI